MPVKEADSVSYVRGGGCIFQKLLLFVSPSKLLTTGAAENSY